MMLPPSTKREDVLSELAVARSDLQGRRDQLVSDFDDKLRQLDELQKEVVEGRTDGRVAVDRLRQIVGERGPLARTTRAGRTQIGMQTPVPRPTTAPAPTRMGPSITMASASIGKAMSIVDQRLAVLLTQPLQSRDELRMEVAFLCRLRASLAQQNNDLPGDVVLLGSVIDFSEDLTQVLVDLQTEGMARVKRLLAFVRELAAQLAAAGVNVEAQRTLLKKHKQALAQNVHEPHIVRDLAQCFSRLFQEYEKRFPSTRKSPIDDLLRS